MSIPDLEAAIQEVYAHAGLEQSALNLGIVPLYELIRAYPLRMDEVRGLSYAGAARFLERETGRPIALPRRDDQPLAGFLHAHYPWGWILVKQEDPIVRRRFTAAHELGHYILHFLPYYRDGELEPEEGALMLAEGLSYGETLAAETAEPCGELMYARSMTAGNYVPYSDVTRMEREANQFAALLLMPETACRTLVERESQRLGTRREALARRLAGEFLVSQEAMRWRLRGLGLLNEGETAR